MPALQAGGRQSIAARECMYETLHKKMTRCARASWTLLRRFVSVKHQSLQPMEVAQIDSRVSSKLMIRVYIMRYKGAGMETIQHRRRVR